MVKFGSQTKNFSKKEVCNHEPMGSDLIRGTIQGCVVKGMISEDLGKGTMLVQKQLCSTEALVVPHWPHGLCLEYD